MQPRPHRSDRAADDAGRGRVADLVQLAEHDDFAIRRRQRLDGRTHRIDGFDARGIVEHRRGIGRELVGQALVFTARPQPLHGQVARDPQEIPRDGAPERVLPRGLPEDREERLLDDVVARVRTAEVDGVAVNRPLVARKQLGKGGFVASARPFEQSGIVHLTHVVPGAGEKFHNLVFCELGIAARGSWRRQKKAQCDQVPKRGTTKRSRPGGACMTNTTGSSR